VEVGAIEVGFREGRGVDEDEEGDGELLLISISIDYAVLERRTNAPAA
jgi:hypothetical protein